MKQKKLKKSLFIFFITLFSIEVFGLSCETKVDGKRHSCNNWSNKTEAQKKALRDYCKIGDHEFRKSTFSTSKCDESGALAKCIYSESQVVFYFSSDPKVIGMNQGACNKTKGARYIKLK